MKKRFRSLFFPNKLVAIFFILIGFGLLVYVFSLHLEGTLIAYHSYALSTYALMIICVRFYSICRKVIKNNFLYRLYHQYTKEGIGPSLYLSTIFNIMYGTFDLIVGCYYRSAWFLTFASYYLLLGMMKVYLLYGVKKFTIYEAKQYKRLKHCGILLLLLNIVFIGMIILILTTHQNIQYAGYIIYVVALYDFYFIIQAFVSIIQHRKSNHPILLASKCINMTVAMVSMLSLEVAMIDQFGENQEGFKMIMTGSMGIVICVFNSIMAIYMIYKANHNLKSK